MVFVKEDFLHSLGDSEKRNVFGDLTRITELTDERKVDS